MVPKNELITNLSLAHMNPLKTVKYFCMVVFIKLKNYHKLSDVPILIKTTFNP